MSNMLEGIVDDNETALYEEAGELFVKLAEEEGVDINSLTEAEIGEALTELVHSGAVTAVKEASEAGYYEEAGITYADVSHELAKVASEHGYDLSELSSEEYNTLFANMAETMSDPGYAEKVAAEQEKIAEADQIGRIMAHSFTDELEKLASVADKATKMLSNRVAKHMQKGKLPAEAMARTGAELVGAGALGGAAAGTGATALYHARKKKEAYDAEVLETAEEILKHAGVGDVARSAGAKLRSAASAVKSKGDDALEAVGTRVSNTSLGNKRMNNLIQSRGTKETMRRLGAESLGAGALATGATAGLGMGVRSLVKNKKKEAHDEAVLADALALLEAEGYGDLL